MIFRSIWHLLSIILELITLQPFQLVTDALSWSSESGKSKNKVAWKRHQVCRSLIQINDHLINVWIIAEYWPTHVVTFVSQFHRGWSGKLGGFCGVNQGYIKIWYVPDSAYDATRSLAWLNCRMKALREWLIEKSTRCACLTFAMAPDNFCLVLLGSVSSREAHFAGMWTDAQKAIAMNLKGVGMAVSWKSLKSYIWQEPPVSPSLFAADLKVGKLVRDCLFQRVLLQLELKRGDCV